MPEPEADAGRPPPRSRRRASSAAGTRARAPRIPRNEPITVGGVTVPPGRRHNLEIPVAKLPTDTSLSLPVAVVNGLRPGPTVWLNAAIHGDEINGVEIIRQLLRLLRPRELHGTVIAVPIVNVFGFVNETRYLPDRRDLNRAFPGSPRGSLTAQLAHLFMSEIVSRCQYGIDYHTGTGHRTNLPQLRVDLSVPDMWRLAGAFGPPVVVHAAHRDGSLRAVCAKRGIPLVVYEGGEAHRFNDDAIRIGIEGTLRVLAALGMRTDNDIAQGDSPLFIRRTQWERARRSGIIRIDVYPGQLVQRGDQIGVMADAFGAANRAVRAPITGVVLGYSRNPIVSQGDALVHLADLDALIDDPDAV
ncbi:MAG: succinylglutamate desuccinylase/aspartoacylase family protein [Acidimicrobiales bacterium]